MHGFWRLAETRECGGEETWEEHPDHHNDRNIGAIRQQPEAAHKRGIREFYQSSS